MISKVFELPYYAVIFTSKRSPGDFGYSEMAQNLLIEAEKIEGFLGADSVRDTEGIGITVSYWRTLEAIDKWKNHTLHIDTWRGKKWVSSNGTKNIQFVSVKLDMKNFLIPLF